VKNLVSIIFLTLLIAAFGAAALVDDRCADDLGCVEIPPGENIVFGGILRLSGPRPWTGEVARDAFQLAVLARGDRLLGREIEFLAADSACSEAGGREAAQHMVENPAIVGIIGTNCSLAAKGALPIISEAGWLMISPSNSSPFLTNADQDAGGLYQPGYFRTTHNDLFQGALSAQFAAIALEVSTVATIDDGDPYTRGLANAMADAFSSLGGEVPFQGVIRKGATDMSGMLSAIAQSGAELVYFPVFAPEAILIAQQMADAPALENTIMMTADAAYSAYFAENAGEAAIGVYVAAPHVAGKVYEAFLKTWKREIDEAGPTGGFHAHSYDAANLLLDAVESAAQERDDGTLVIGRGALREALASVEDYPGLTGLLTCQDESPHAGDCATGEALAIFQLGAAEIHESNWPPPVVWTAKMAAAK
jgi:branched-chain amino acid transport system substrate-binding protein